jgi:hypothetical protein
MRKFPQSPLQIHIEKDCFACASSSWTSSLLFTDCVWVIFLYIYAVLWFGITFPDANSHVDAYSDPDTDWHQNDAILMEYCIL